MPKDNQNLDTPQAAILGFPTNIPKKDANQGMKGFADMTPEEAKASLGIATHLMGGLMPQVPQEGGDKAPQTQEKAPQGQEKPKAEADTQQREMGQMQGKFEQFTKDIETRIDDRFTQLTDMIKQALAEDESED